MHCFESCYSRVKLSQYVTNDQHTVCSVTNIYDFPSGEKKFAQAFFELQDF